MEHYWQSANGGSARTSLLQCARLAAEAIHTAVEGAKWAVQHAKAKLKAAPPAREVKRPDPVPPPRAVLPFSAPPDREPKAALPPESESSVQTVAERTAAALLSDRRYGAGVGPQLPPLEVNLTPEDEESEGGGQALALAPSPVYAPITLPRNPRSRSPSPERQARLPLTQENTEEAEPRDEQRRTRGIRKMRRRARQGGGPLKGLAGGLLLAGVTLLVGLVGREKLLNRAPEIHPPSIASVAPSPPKKERPQKAPRPPLSDIPPPAPAEGVIPQGVRLPDAVPPAAEWKRAIPPSVIALPSMDSREADALVRKWHAAKADALGPRHAVGQLGEVALPPLRTHWGKIAEDARRGGRYWNYKLLDVTVDSAKVWRAPEGGEEEASLEVTIEEAAELVDTRDDSDNAVYYR